VRRISERLDQANIQDMIAAQPPRPFRVALAQRIQESPAACELDHVPLPIVEADGLAVREAVERPQKARR
jgi:hypothetical protein